MAAALSLLSVALPSYPPDWKPLRTTIDFRRLPPLLPLENDQLLTQSLTHKAYAIQQSSVIDQDPVDLDLACYKELELEGDAYLHLYTTVLLKQRCPRFTAGALAELRLLVTSNATLSFISRHYGFNERVLLSSTDSRMGLRDNQKLNADVFEAYVGALFAEARIKGRGPALDRVELWLDRLYSFEVFPDLEGLGKAKLAQFASVAQNEHVVPNGAKRIRHK